jgi:WD40 repeat protein
MFLFSLEPLAALGSIDAHPFPIDQVLFTPDGQSLITLGQEGNIRVWDFAGKEQLHNFGQFRPAPQQIALSADGTLLAAAFPAEIQVWRMDTYLPVKTIPIPDDSARSLLAFSPDQSVLAAAGNTDNVSIWQLESGNLLAGLPGHSRRMAGVAFSGDGRLALTGTAGPGLFLWNLSAVDPSARDPLNQLRVPKADIAPPGSDVYTLAWSPNGQMIAVGDVNGPVYILGIPSSDRD